MGNSTGKYKDGQEGQGYYKHVEKSVIPPTDAIAHLKIHRSLSGASMPILDLPMDSDGQTYRHSYHKCCSAKPLAA